MGTKNETSQVASSDGEKVDAIAKILGVSDTTNYTALRKAFDDLALPVTTTRHAALRSLSDREIAMCRETGVDIVEYAAKKARTKPLARAATTTKTVRASVGTLSPREAEMCKEMEVDPKVYAAKKAATRGGAR